MPIGGAVLVEATQYVEVMTVGSIIEAELSQIAESSSSGSMSI